MIKAIEVTLPDVHVHDEEEITCPVCFSKRNWMVMDGAFEFMLNHFQALVQYVLYNNNVWLLGGFGGVKDCWSRLAVQQLVPTNALDVNFSWKRSCSLHECERTIESRKSRVQVRKINYVL